MTVRTQDEVVARYRATRAEDVLGFRAEVLLEFMDETHVREIAPDADLSEIDWSEVLPLDEEHVGAALRRYLEFAFGKALDHRGISASRSVEKLSEYAWLLGDDELVAQIEAAAYAPYGMPTLAVIARRVQVPLPDDPRAARMIEGLPCRPDCMEGCPS